MQKEIDSICFVFNKDGTITGAWSKTPVFKFNSKLYKNKHKIDHRQCFFAENENCSVYISLEKCGIEFIVKIILRDKKLNGTAVDCIVKKYLLNKKDIPNLLNERVYFEDKKIKIALTSQQSSKHIRCQFNDFAGYDNLYLDLTFIRQQSESLNLSLPFEYSDKNFYYKAFSPMINISGNIKLGDNQYIFSDSTGYCDSTNYNLPFRQIYRCVTANCNINGKDFALYFGSKLGDDLVGEENCYFSDGKIKKLSKIKFLGTDERIDKIWNFKAGIKAVDVIFKPEFYKDTPVFAKCDKTTIVYGKLYGEFNLLNSDSVNLNEIPAQMIFTVI
ncbi:MAG: DUF2804 family protein [Ruminococcus sp.]|nr:DUF2804 family protein [Ruminococcus sp.]